MATTIVSSQANALSRNRFEARLQAALEITFQRLRERVMAAVEIHTRLTITFWEQEEGRLAALLTPLLRDGLMLGVEAEQRHFLEQGITTNVQPHVQRTVEHLGHTLARQIIDTLADRANHLINTWSDSNKPIDALDAVLQTAVLSRSYAEMVAATETTRAITAGQLLIWRAMRPPAKFAPVMTPPDAPAFVVGKRWRVRRDEHVCPICEPLNGKVVGLDEKFERPDINLVVDAPPAHPRCRCYLEPMWSNEVFRKPASQEEDAIHILERYGVTVNGNFHEDQLAVLRDTVETIAEQLAEAYPCTPSSTPTEMFRTVFGRVQFRYNSDPNATQGLTQMETDTGLAVVNLPASVFFAGTRVPAHELGHVFHNRLGRTAENTTATLYVVEVSSGEETHHEVRVVYPGDTLELNEQQEHVVYRIEVPENTPTVMALYLYYTGGEWYPFGVPRRDPEGRIVRNQTTGDIVYDVLPGTYEPGEYDPALSGRDRDRYFPNEQGTQTPMEGFADTFAVYMMLGPDVLLDDPRRVLFDQLLTSWVKSRCHSERNITPTPEGRRQ